MSATITRTQILPLAAPLSSIRHGPSPNQGEIIAEAGLGISLSATATIDNTGTIFAPGSIDGGVSAIMGTLPSRI